VTDAAESPTNPQYFRKVFGHLPTGVVVVTGRSLDDELVGVTIGSFASISLDPPLAGFFIGRASRSWSLIAARGKFCANVLAASQTELCWRFAKDATDGLVGSRFDGLEVGVSANGSPLLPGVVATIDCDVHAVHSFGDHDLVVGSVSALRTLQTDVPAMVFVQGKTGDARIIL
jgi:flavin reductase (DIM6/NTAB) family NADH-FMN oxidoreductase RutF